MYEDDEAVETVSTTNPCAGIDEAVSRLDDIEQCPLTEHVERFDAVHTELTVALATIDKV